MIIRAGFPMPAQCARERYWTSNQGAGKEGSDHARNQTASLLRRGYVMNRVIRGSDRPLDVPAGPPRGGGGARRRLARRRPGGSRRGRRRRRGRRAGRARNRRGALDHGRERSGPTCTCSARACRRGQIQATVDSIASQQVGNQFGTQRYALLFEPGTYGSAADPLIFQVGYYTGLSRAWVSPG